MELSSKKRQRTIKEIAIVLRTVYAYISTLLPSKEDQWTYNKITYFVCLCLLFFAYIQCIVFYLFEYM